MYMYFLNNVTSKLVNVNQVFKMYFTADICCTGGSFCYCMSYFFSIMFIFTRDKWCVQVDSTIQIFIELWCLQLNSTTPIFFSFNTIWIFLNIPHMRIDVLYGYNWVKNVHLKEYCMERRICFIFIVLPQTRVVLLHQPQKWIPDQMVQQVMDQMRPLVLTKLHKMNREVQLQLHLHHMMSLCQMLQLMTVEQPRRTKGKLNVKNTYTWRSRSVWMSL